MPWLDGSLLSCQRLWPVQALLWLIRIVSLAHLLPPPTPRVLSKYQQSPSHVPGLVQGKQWQDTVRSMKVLVYGAENQVSSPCHSPTHPPHSPPQGVMEAQRPQERWGWLLEEVMGTEMGEDTQAKARDSTEHSRKSRWFHEQKHGYVQEFGLHPESHVCVML